MIRLRRGVTVAAVFFLAACDGEAPAAGPVTRDSAGVRITISPDRVAPFVVLDTIPSLSIGELSDVPGREFSRVASIVVPSDGSLWVADEFAVELRVFGRDATLRAVLGGRGEGPGEFQRMRLVGVLPGDTVVVVDDGQARVTLYAGEDRTREFRLPAAGPLVVGAFGGEEFLGTRYTGPAFSSMEVGDVTGGLQEVLRWNVASGTARTLGTAPTGASIRVSDRLFLPVPFTSGSGVTVMEDRAFVTTGPAFRVRVFDGSGLHEVFGVDRAAQPVAGPLTTRYRSHAARYPESSRREMEDLASNPAVPASAPAFDDLVADSEGRIWARRAANFGEGPEVWDVFGSDRGFLGSVTMPDGFRLEAAVADAVVGVWTDESRVEHVRRYEFLRGPS